MERLNNTLVAIWDTILGLLYPQKCLGCGIRGTSLCITCSTQIPQTHNNLGNNLYACFDYQYPLIKQAIWNLKYHKRKNLGHILGKLVAETLLEEYSDLIAYTGGTPIIIIPVPLSPKRMKERSYNQAEYIARGFAHYVGKSCIIRTDIIKKIKDTLPQARLQNKNVRLRNVKNAFNIYHKEDIKGRTIIVIDDVTTTGATITEIINILEKGGARKVVGFAVTH